MKWIMIYGSLVPFFAMVTLLYILGVARYITDFEENTCEMTYMFEYPQYVVRIAQDILSDCSVLSTVVEIIRYAYLSNPYLLVLSFETRLTTLVFFVSLSKCKYILISFIKSKFLSNIFYFREYL